MHTFHCSILFTPKFQILSYRLAIVLYLLSSFRTFPGRANVWLQRAALFTLGAAILLAVVETIRWFAGAR